MLMKEIIEIYELLDTPYASGESIKSYFEDIFPTEIEISKVDSDKANVDFIRIRIKGEKGKDSGGSSPTLLIIGRLGGIGARPNINGFVSDGEGALVVLALAAKILKMKAVGDELSGDVIICTNITPDAPIINHEPVPFMASPVDMNIMNENEVVGNFDAVFSVDTTKGNNLINRNGFAISPTVKEGYILKPSSDILKLIELVTGEKPSVLPLAMQDITPYGNGLHHINSIMQPAVATNRPVVGLAITSKSVVSGCFTESTNPYIAEECARVLLSIVKAFGDNKINLYDKEEYEKLVRLYGSMRKMQTKGNG